MESRHARVDVGTAELACLVDGPTGPDSAVAVCVHGFPDGASSFRHQVAPLVSRGFTVVRPWTRGYRPSSLAFDGRYDVERLADDLLALADHFSPARPIVLIGHDWGAIAAYAAGARAPTRIARLCTLAVPHLRTAARRWASLRQLRKSWYVGLFQLRGLAERPGAADDFRLIDRLWRAWSPGHYASPDELSLIKDGFRDPTHLAAVLAYYRALFPSGATRWLRKKIDVPALYLHGVDDGCVGVELADNVESAYLRGVRVCRVAGAGHFLQLERPDEINRLLLDFLDG